MSRRGRSASRSTYERERSAGALLWSGTYHSIGNRLLREYARGRGARAVVLGARPRRCGGPAGLLASGTRPGRRQRSAFRARTRASRSIRIASTASSRWRHARKVFPWCSDWGDELTQLFRRTSKSSTRSSCSTTTICCSTGASCWPSRARARDRRALRSRADRRVSGHEHAAGARSCRLKPTASVYAWSATTRRRSTPSARRRSTTSWIFPNGSIRRRAVVTLEQNYRSMQPILDAANALMSAAASVSRRSVLEPRVARQRRRTSPCRTIRRRRCTSSSRCLRRASRDVLLRTSRARAQCASQRRCSSSSSAPRIPYVKYGGLKFLEAAHVKDVLALLRWADNPRNRIAGFRVLQLLPGVGPADRCLKVSRRAARGRFLPSTA